MPSREVREPEIVQLEHSVLLPPNCTLAHIPPENMRLDVAQCLLLAWLPLEHTCSSRLLPA